MGDEEAEQMACWAHVIVDPEDFSPREATEGELEELSDLNLSVTRLWIQPGPIGGDADE